MQRPQALPPHATHCGMLLSAAPQTIRKLEALKVFLSATVTANFSQRRGNDFQEHFGLATGETSTTGCAQISMFGKRRSSKKRQSEVGKNTT